MYNIKINVFQSWQLNWLTLKWIQKFVGFSGSYTCLLYPREFLQWPFLQLKEKSMHEKLFWNFIMNLYKILTFSKRFLSSVWIRDWCKKNWTGLDSTIKMDIFSIFWLPLLLHSHIGTLIFPGAYQNSFLSLRVLRNTLGSIGTPRTQIQRFCK